jgi:hypothetical protein
MRKFSLLAAALLPVGFALTLAGEGGKCTEKCAGKDAAKCCAEGAAKVVLTAEKAEALAKEIKLETCPGKSAELLASALPGLKCKDTLAKLTADIKSKECPKEAANLILAAVKEYGEAEKKPVLTAEKAEALAKEIKAESCPVKSGELLASALPGLKCRDTLAKLTADIKSKECPKEAANLILAAVKQYGASEEKSCCDAAKGKAVALNAEKALLIAAQLRAESCPVKSSEILAAALPELKCQETLAKLVSEIKAKGCEKEASELILAAQAKLAQKPEAKK